MSLYIFVIRCRVSTLFGISDGCDKNISNQDRDGKFVS